MGEYDDIIMRSLNWAENLRRQQMGMPSTDVENLSNRQYYGTWRGYDIPGRVPGVSISVGPGPELSGLKNVDYTNDQLIKMGEGWKKDVAKANPKDYSGFANAAMATGDFLAHLYNSTRYGQTAGDLIQQARTSNQSVGGYGFTTKSLDSRAVMDQEHQGNVGNTIGSTLKGAQAGAAIGGPVGAAVGGAVGLIGGLFGGGRRHAQARAALAEANAKIGRNNQFNYGIASTQAVQQNFRNQYGQPEQQLLHAHRGLDGMFNPGKIKLVQTKNGFKLAPHTAYGEGGEPIGNPDTGEWDVIKPVVGGDNELVGAEPGDRILTPNDGIAQRGIPHVEAIKQIDAISKMLYASAKKSKGEASSKVAENVARGAISKLAQERDMHNEALRELTKEQEIKHDLGILPQPTYAHAANGWDWGNFLANAMSGMVGLGQYWSAKNDDIAYDNTYVPHGAYRGYDLLSGLNINPFPMFDAINRQRAIASNKIVKSGGLSGGQKMAGQIANYANAMAANSDASFKAQEQNNKYRAAEADAVIKGRMFDAQNQMRQMTSDYYRYDKGHARRLGGMQTGLYNAVAAAQQYIKNANQLAMYRGMYDLWSDDLKNRLGSNDKKQMS